jgi:TonB family protein
MFNLAFSPSHAAASVRALVCVLACALACPAAVSRGAAWRHVAARWQRATVAVLDFGDAEAGRRAADELHDVLRQRRTDFAYANRAQARAAARGAGYAGSLNLSLEEARDLGAAVGCDFLVAGRAETVRRSSFSRPDYFESYASVFVVSAFTGRLVRWEHLSAEAQEREAAERALMSKLREAADAFAVVMARAREDEREEHRLSVERDTPVIEDAPGEGTPEARNFRVPLPYRRLRPDYTEEAARVGAEATVDALVALDEEGEVKSVEIVRWAGFKLDEAVAQTIRRMHFRPALREGKAVPVRVLLRYNFRRPKQEEGKGEG